jgi:SPP1 family predicted phage head-tail adaptor
MDSRSLNRIVVIQRPAATQDAAGQPIPTWATLATVWANVRHLSGSETIKADAEASTVKASIRILRRTDIDASMRVALGTTNYQIRAVLPDEIDRDKMDLVCEIVHG